MHRRRTNIILLVCSLLLAAGIWFVHILSQSYYASLPFSIRAVTDVDGYAPESVAGQTIFLGGKLSGFDLLGYNLSGRHPIEIKVEIPFDGDDFSVKSTSISDRISESVNSFFEMTYMPETVLTFEFEPRQFKRVPVYSMVSVSCRPQYMQISDIVFDPDSVTVYGNESVLENVSCIATRQISVDGLKKSTSGVVALEKDAQLRISPENVSYSVKVARYYEYTYPVNLSAINVPSDKNLILLPSQVDVTCRLPYGTETETFAREALFVVDYRDVIASRSAKVAPKMEDTGCAVYSCSFSPAFVECIISEVDR